MEKGKLEEKVSHLMAVAAEAGLQVRDCPNSDPNPVFTNFVKSEPTNRNLWSCDISRSRRERSEPRKADVVLEPLLL